MSLSGYMGAIFSVLVLLLCALSMLREKYEPEIWAILEFPDGDSRSIHNWECILGRSRSSDVQLEDRDCAKSHAALQRSVGGRWAVYALDKRYATFVNGNPVKRKARLRNGDALSMGATDLRFVVLTKEQRKQLQKQRRIPGRRIHPGVTLLLLTVFQAFLLLEFTFTTLIEYRQGIALAFGVLIGLEWICYFVIRALDIMGFEVETLAFYLSTVGLAVTASSDPGGMLKATALLVAGVVLFALMQLWLRKLRRVKMMRWPMAIAALGLLAVNFVFSEAVFGARNWLNVGGVSLQPSELIKVAYVYAGAATLDRLFRRRNILMFIGFSAVIVCALALMGDFGSALVFFVCFLVVSYMRSGSVGTVLLALSGAAMAGALVLTARPYVARRFATWGHVWEDPLGAGYQQVRCMTATASGGLFGHGAGNGWLRSIAAADTDLVFGMVCEELGLIVGFCCMGAIILLALFTVRGASAGRSAYYVIAGCAAVTMMMTQTALNVFGSLDLLPFTGVTFPFVSRGGSSFISCWTMLAYMKAGDTRQNATLGLRSDGYDDEDDSRIWEEDFPDDNEEDEIEAPEDGEPRPEDEALLPEDEEAPDGQEEDGEFFPAPLRDGAYEDELREDIYE